MSLLFIDSFDDRTIGFADKYDANTGTGSSVSGRTGNGMKSNDNAFKMQKNLPASKSTVIVGKAVKFDALTSPHTSILDILDAGTVQVNLKVQADGTLQLKNGSGTVIGTTSAVVTAATFYYIELKVTIHNTAGAYTLKLNGTTVLSGSSANTRNSANNSANQVALRDSSTAQDVTFDDYYICDDQGSVNNDFLGQVRIECLKPSGAGNSTVLAIGGSSPAATNWQSVNEATPDDGVTFVSSSNASDKDLYALQDLATTTGVIVGVHTGFRAQIDSAGPRGVQKVLRSGGTDYDGTARVMMTSWVNWYEVDETNPNTVAAWTIASVNALQAGVKVAS